MNDTDTDTAPPSPFHDLDAYVALPRVSGLVCAPDGDALVVTVSCLDPENTTYVNALWEVDPTGAQPTRRLTHGLRGEGGAAFTSEGDLLFVAKRPTAEVGEDKATPALWLLPAGGGEARQIASRPGGISGVLAARDAPVVVVSSEVMPSATDAESDQAILDARKENKVAAILHSDYPIRFWDHDLGPAAPRLFAADLADDDTVELRDLTPDAGKALIEADSDLSGDGTTIVTTWRVPSGRGAVRTQLVRIDVATGERVVLADAADAEFHAGRISPGGRMVAYVRESITTPDSAPQVSLWVCGIDGSNPRQLAAEWDRWPGEPVWLPDASGLLMATDDDGRSPVFHLTLDGEVTRLTGDAAAYSNLSVAPDGRTAYALRSSYEFPAEVVRIDLTGVETERVRDLRGPVPRPVLPGELREVEATAADGARVRSWLALPDGASAENPAPLLLWIHGGPLNSWNAWSWRWCPWILVAQGYAVLLPDPALSTGYGQDFIQRGWGSWGAAPFTDLMSATDAAEALPEIDQTRTAAMGGSFGGYMANWVAGHTDRFKAIITHASLWGLDAFGGTTDAGYYWNREMTPEMAEANSPHQFVGQIRTPMLVIHGDKDYRVPIGEGLRLWHDLLSASGLPAAVDGSTVHRFLYFPDENHWILTPQHAKVWYQVIEGYLAEHVLGKGAPELPDVLG